MNDEPEWDWAHFSYEIATGGVGGFLLGVLTESLNLVGPGIDAISIAGLGGAALGALDYLFDWFRSKM